jgi:hypothetical protein
MKLNSYKMAGINVNPFPGAIEIFPLISAIAMMVTGMNDLHLIVLRHQFCMGIFDLDLFRYPQSP